MFSLMHKLTTRCRTISKSVLLNFLTLLKVSKSRKKFGVHDSSERRRNPTILTTEGAQDSEFRSIFRRIQDAIICFPDLLTFHTPHRVRHLS